MKSLEQLFGLNIKPDLQAKLAESPIFLEARFIVASILGQDSKNGSDIKLDQEKLLSLAQDQKTKL